MRKLLFLILLPIALMGCKKEFEEPNYGPGSVVLYEIECAGCQIKLPATSGMKESIQNINGAFNFNHVLGDLKIIPIEITTVNSAPTLLKFRWSVDGFVILLDEVLIDSRKSYKKSADLTSNIK